MKERFIEDFKKCKIEKGGDESDKSLFTLLS